MEHDDWGPVISRIEHDHYNSQEAVAKAFSIALMGDEDDWRQHMTNAKRLMSHMSQTIPSLPHQSNQSEDVNG